MSIEECTYPSPQPLSCCVWFLKPPFNSDPHQLLIDKSKMYSNFGNQNILGFVGHYLITLKFNRMLTKQFHC